MARHFLTLPDVATLRTPSYRLIHEAVTTAAEQRAIVVSHGDAGCGKTFATEDAANGVTGMETCWTVFPSRATQKRVVKQLLQNVTGVTHDGERYSLIDTALEVLGDRPRLLVIDEAQELSAEALELLRHLWDDPGTDFALVLTGATGCWETISRYPPLESRVLRNVHVQRLAASDVVELMPTFHPLYAQTPIDVIEFIDMQFGKGNLRNWARFTRDAATYCERRGVAALSQELAIGIFALQRGARATTAAAGKPQQQPRLTRRPSVSRTPRSTP